MIIADNRENKFPDKEPGDMSNAGPRFIPHARAFSGQQRAVRRGRAGRGGFTGHGGGMIVLGDVVAMSTAFLVEAVIRKHLAASVPVLVALLGVGLGSLYLSGLYDESWSDGQAKWLTSIGFSMALTAAVGMTVRFLAPSLIPRRFAFLLAMVLAALFVAAWRRLAFTLFPRELAHVGILVGSDGTNDVATRVASSVHVKRVELFAFPGLQHEETELERLRQESFVGHFDAVVVGRSVVCTDALAETLLVLRCQGAVVLDCAEALETFFDFLDLDSLVPEWMALSSRLVGTSRSSSYDRIKRAVDITLATLGLAAAAVPVLVCILAIRLGSKGPALFSQIRVGLYGRPFRIWKLRTMRFDAEAGGPRWATEGDPRVTPIGRFLRATRIDELPQLVNVLRGDMSIVGPRPERPEFVSELEKTIPYYSLRHMVRPGVTGWAQVQYRYGRSVEDARRKLEYDLYYIRHQSAVMEARILAKTIRVMVRGSFAT